VEKEGGNFDNKRVGRLKKLPPQRGKALAKDGDTTSGPLRAEKRRAQKVGTTKKTLTENNLWANGKKAKGEPKRVGIKNPSERGFMRTNNPRGRKVAPFTQY